MVNRWTFAIGWSRANPAINALLGHYLWEKPSCPGVAKIGAVRADATISANIRKMPATYAKASVPRFGNCIFWIELQ